MLRVRERIVNKMKQIDKAIKYMGGDKLSSYEIEEIKRLWPSVKKAIRNGIYANVDTVSKSGMSRTITVRIKHKGEIINLNYTPYWKIYGDSRKNGVVRIGGYIEDPVQPSTNGTLVMLVFQVKENVSGNSLFILSHLISLSSLICPSIVSSAALAVEIPALTFG